MTDSGVGTVNTSTDKWNITEDYVTTAIPDAKMVWGNMTLSTTGDDSSVWDNSTFVFSTESNFTTASYVNSTETLENSSDADATNTLVPTGIDSTVASMTTFGTAVSEVAVAAAAFMAIFLLAALVGNLFCLIALRHKKLEKTVMIYTCLGNLCAVQFCDSLLNMPLILGATLSGSWPYGTFMCQLSAFILNLLNAETILALTLLALDRLLAVRWSTTYSNMNRVKASLITGYTWLHGTLFTLFILAGVIPAEYLPDCYLCSVSSATGFVYVVFFSLFCYIFPLLIVISMYIIIIKVAVDEKPTVQHFNAEVHYANRLGRRSQLWKELRRAKTTGALVILWCLFQGPYLALQTVYLYGNSSYPSETDNVFSTPVKTAFTWMRYCYPWIVPFVVIVGFPEVREEFSNAIACHKNNMVNSGRQEMLEKAGVGPRTSWASDVSSSRPSTLGRSFQIPVLFATSGGLRLQIGNNQRENDVDRAADYHHEGFRQDPRMKYDPTKSRYAPPLAPVPQSSDEDTGRSWDIHDGSPEPEEIAQEATLVSTISSSDPSRVRSSSTSSSFQLSLTSRELKLQSGTPRSPNGTPHSPFDTPGKVDPETPPGSIPPSQSNTPR